MMTLPVFYADEIIDRALKEDINYIDVATDLTIDSDETSHAVMLAKADGVLCGLDIAMRVFSHIGTSVTFETYKKDGDRIKKGEIIAELDGLTRELLKGERTALNIIQHMSGIATATARCVELVKGTRATVADTRKTLPGLRAIEKYAVMTGGGKNHRFNLSDAAMLKDNHIDAAGSITAAVKKLREHLGHTVKIEVETRNLDEVKEALDSRADIIMLDNMSTDEMKKAGEVINGRALSEASGGITEQNIAEIAACGVDIISLGALTHSAKALDISLKIKK